MQKTQQKASKIFLLPAENDANEQIYFLFSQNQVVEILQQINLHSVPFAEPFIKGIAGYNDKLIPVISPEELLGMKCEKNQPFTQFAVIRSAKTDPVTGENLRAILASRTKMELPKEETENILQSFSPSSLPSSYPDSSMVKAVFENKGIHVVLLDIEKLLLGNGTGTSAI